MKTKQISLFLPILGLGVAPAATLIDFESYALSSNLAVNGWSVAADSSAVTVVTTANSGAYIGGRAIQTDPSGATFAGLLVTQPGVSGLQVDMNWAFRGTPGGTITPTIQLSAWADAGDDGVFASGERQVGLAMDNDETDFEFMSGTGEIDGTTSTTFSADNWYRLTLTWTAPDGGGSRDVTLNGFDLTNNTDLGVVNTVTMTAGQFGADPADWDGVGIRMSRGMMDNITLIPEPNSALLGLAGALIAFMRRRRS